MVTFLHPEIYRSQLHIDYEQEHELINCVTIHLPMMNDGRDRTMYE